MVRMPLLVVLLITVVGLSAPPARLADDGDPSGVYSCDGVNPAGRPYRGIVEIVKAQETFHLRWTFPQDGDSALGIGIMSNGVLAVSYYGSATAGVVVYKLEDGKLVGDWTIAGAGGGVYHETLKRLSERERGNLPRGNVPDDDDHRPADREQRPAPPRGNPSKVIQG